MSKILILEDTGEQLKAKGYRKCTKEKYQEYKKNSDYLTAVADEGGYYYKKKSTTSKPDPKKDPAPAPNPKPQPDNQPKDDPNTKLPEPKPKDDPNSRLPEPDSNEINDFCLCWTEENFFDEFPQLERSKMASEFSLWVKSNDIRSIRNSAKIAQDRVTANKCQDSNCLRYQQPFIRVLSNITEETTGKVMFKVWKESLSTETQTQKKTETEVPTSSIKYLDLTIDKFVESAKKTKLYIDNIDDFQTNLTDLLALHASSKFPSSEGDVKKFRNCKETAEKYIELYNRRIEDSFGDPDSEDLDYYDIRSKYWYVFLKTLFDIKRNLRICLSSNVDFGKNKGRLDLISPRSIWRIDLNNLSNEKEDTQAMSKVKQNLVPENFTIRKKLIEYKEMKTLKESVRNKILLTKENKDKKVNKISENLYKIAGDFYNERYDVFFNKYVRLKESYRKSKMFLMEGASDNFKNAFVRVFKGDEEDLVRVAIPWFTNKLGLEGTVKSEVEEKLKNKYSGDDIADLFEDDWSDIVVLSIINNAKSDVSEPTNAMDAVEKALMSNMRADFKEDLKNSIKNLIYPVQDSRKTEIVNLANELKNAILASKDGKESQKDTDSKVDDIFS